MTDTGDFAAADSLFAELAALGDGDPRRGELQRQIVVIYQPMARRIAAKFSGRGEDRDDLEQVAAIGLVKAVARFDPGRDVAFLGFAIPTMMGEVRRYFRDSAWSVKLPRRLSELCLSLNRATRELSQQLGRAPTPSQLARHLDITVDEVFEGLEAAQSYRAASLDGSAGDDDAPGLIDRLGGADHELAIAEDRALLLPALRTVPERERGILAMRFFQGLTQTEIADRIGLSQMQVSRLLARTLHQLRGALSDADPTGRGDPTANGAEAAPAVRGEPRNSALS